jgi:hypothetical protein
MASRKVYRSWTPIAARERTSSNVWEKIAWVEYPDAQVTMVEARLLARTGQLLLATRNTVDHVEAVIRTPSRRRSS